MIILNTVEDLGEYVLQNTRKARELSSAGQDSSGLSPEILTLQTSLQDVFAKDIFGCQTTHVKAFARRLFKDVTGKDLDLSGIEEDYSYARWTMIVPLTSTQGSVYPVNRPFLVTKKSGRGRATSCLYLTKEIKKKSSKVPLSEGNNYFGSWRYATDEEINLFFSVADSTELQKLIEST